MNTFSLLVDEEMYAFFFRKDIELVIALKVVLVPSNAMLYYDFKRMFIFLFNLFFVDVP